MAIGTGMRAKDVRDFMRVARDFQIIILIRHTNDDSLRYVGKDGYYPKPALLKAKTADVNPPTRREFINGSLTTVSYDVAGLVVHPGFQPDAYLGAKKDKAYGCWDVCMKTLTPHLKGRRVDLTNPDTWAEWSVERTGKLATDWKWRVDVDPESTHFGAVQLQKTPGPWWYIHGDYDLKDVLVLGSEGVNQRNEGTRDGVKNFTPELPGRDWITVRDALNRATGIDLVQHGAEAQFAWHGDEPITVIYPDWRFEILGNAAAVQSWYEKLNRQVLATTGTDYLRDPTRAFYSTPDGLVSFQNLPEGFTIGS
jgi:hypothetical protein